MAELTKRAINIICTIGDRDISNKAILDLTVNRNFSDIANKFTMTIVDTPKANIGYDLELYMNAGHRDITLKYGDLNLDNFQTMKGTIWDYTCNFVGNIKTLQISGIVSAYSSSNIVGNTTYNIDWNSYVNKRKNTKQPWNITEIARISNNLAASTIKYGDREFSGSDFKNSYILYEQYRNAINYNSETIRLWNKSRFIDLPVPDLFVPVNNIPSAEEEKSSYNSWSSSKSDYHEYWKYTSDKGPWGKLHRDTYTSSRVGVMWDTWSSLTYKHRYKTITTGYLYQGFREAGKYIRVVDIIDITNIYIGPDVLIKGSNGNIETMNDWIWKVYPGAYSIFSDGAKLINMIINSSDFFGQTSFKYNSKDGNYYLYNNTGAVISLPINGYTEEDFKNNPSVVIGNTYINIGSIRSSELRDALNRFARLYVVDFVDESSKSYYLKGYSSNHGGNNTQRWSSLEAIPAYLRKAFEPGYEYTRFEKLFVRDALASTENTIDETIYWKDASDNIRGFNYNGVLYIEAKPGTPSYTQASFLNSGAGVDISYIVKQLARLEGWLLDERYITQTATMSNSDTYIMNGITAVDFIYNNLMPNSITPVGRYQLNKEHVSSDGTKYSTITLTSAASGFILYFDDNKYVHYRPVDSAKISTTDIRLGYNIPDSPVISFSVNTKGTAFYNQSNTKISTLTVTTGQEISELNGVQNATGVNVVESSTHNSFLDDWYGGSYAGMESYISNGNSESNYYTKCISENLVNNILVSSKEDRASVTADMQKAVDKIKNFTILGTMQMWGNTKIKPAHYINILNMIKGGINNSDSVQTHPSSGMYLIQSQTDKISDSGFIQELNLIRKTKDLDKLLIQDDIDWDKQAAWIGTLG